MKRILVTGINGFVGKHLARELRAQDCQVIGLGYHEPINPTIKDIVTEYFDCDLNDKQAVAKLPLASINGVINLAGLAQVGDSFKNPELYMKVNVGVLKNLGEMLIDHKSSARLIAISTGAVYDSGQAMPLTEESKLIVEGSPYALSKIAMEESAQQLKQAGLDCVVVRPFNHIGPGQAPGFLLPDLFAKISQAEQIDHSIMVGNLNTRRDYTDVRDVVRAYAQLVLVDKLSYGIYNVCSGKSILGQTILETLLVAMGQTGQIRIQTDPSLIRPSDPIDLYGSYQRLSQDTGWQPVIKLDTTIGDFVKTQVA